MTETEIKNLNDSDLVERLHETQHILSVAVYGALNEDFGDSPEGLYWIKEDIINLSTEVSTRLLNSNKSLPNTQ